MERYSELAISQTAGRPMYRQIKEQIEESVAVGNWPPGHALPSIRELAAALRVSVITVKRAYQELERDGVIVTQHGKGSFVAPDPDLKPKLQQAEFDRLLARLLEIARRLGVGPDELAHRMFELSETPTLSVERK